MTFNHFYYHDFRDNHMQQFNRMNETYTSIIIAA